MKKLFKTTVALLSATAMLFSFAACGEKEPVNAETTTNTAVIDETTTANTNETEPVTDDVTTDVAPSEEATSEAASEATTQDASEPAEVSETQAEITAPTDKAEILKLFNDASAKVVSSKPGFKKSTVTQIPVLEMGALAKISVVRTTVGDFLGEGSSNATVAKGKSNSNDYLKSSLSAADVTNATCKLSADKKFYEIQLTVKNETNPLKAKSSLGKFTNDFKDQQEIIKGLDEAGAEAGTVTMTTTSVVITAKISVEDAKFSALSYAIKMDAVLTDVKYTIAKVKKATGKLTTDVTFSGFAY